MLRQKPIDVNENCWYYEEKAGVCIVYQIYDSKGNYVRTDQFYIPWKKLLESVKRKYNL